MNGKFARSALTMTQHKNPRPSTNSSLPSCTKFEEQDLANLGGRVDSLLKVHQLMIFSPDRFVRDFLKGILVFQGYECMEVSDDPFLIQNITFHPNQVVFFDGLYFLGEESRLAQCRALNWVRAGMKVMILADRRWDSKMIREWEMRGYQILWKPLDYRQLSVVMAQIGFEPKEVGQGNGPGRWPVQDV